MGTLTHMRVKTLIELKSEDKKDVHEIAATSLIVIKMHTCAEYVKLHCSEELQFMYG